MNPQLHFLLSVAAFSVALVALGVSLTNAFPGFRTLLAVLRDGVLWVALFFVLGGAGFVVWQRMQQLPGSETASNPRLEAVASQLP